MREKSSGGQVAKPALKGHTLNKTSQESIERVEEHIEYSPYFRA